MEFLLDCLVFAVGILEDIFFKGTKNMDLVNIFKTSDSQNNSLLNNLRPHFDSKFLSIFLIIRHWVVYKHIKTRGKHFKHMFFL